MLLQPLGYHMSPKAIQCQLFPLLFLGKLKMLHLGSLQWTLIDSSKNTSNRSSHTTCSLAPSRWLPGSLQEALPLETQLCSGLCSPAWEINPSYHLHGRRGMAKPTQQSFPKELFSGHTPTLEDQGRRLRPSPQCYSSRMHSLAFAPLIRKWHNPVLLLRSLLDIYPVPKGTLRQVWLPVLLPSMKCFAGISFSPIPPPKNAPEQNFIF